MFYKMARSAQRLASSNASLFDLPNVISLLLVRRFSEGGVSRLEKRDILNLVWEKTPPKTYSPEQAGGAAEAREDEFKISGIPRDFDAIDWLQAMWLRSRSTATPTSPAANA